MHKNASYLATSFAYLKINPEGKDKRKFLNYLTHAAKFLKLQNDRAAEKQKEFEGKPLWECKHDLHINTIECKENNKIPFQITTFF